MKETLETTQGRLRNSEAASAVLGLKPGSIRVYCVRHDIGSKIAGTWWLTDEEVAYLQTRKGKVGRPQLT